MMRASALKLSRNESGSIAVMSAVTLTLVVSLSAITIESGHMYLTRRHQQAATDFAAMAAAANTANATSVAKMTLSTNGVEASTLSSLELGHYAADPATPVKSRFAVSASEDANAVKVTVTRRVPLVFAPLLRIGRLDGTAEIVTTAIGAIERKASFSLGSRLVSLNGGIENAILGQLLGANVSLTAMDYRALAAANVNLFTYYKNLATRANLASVTYGDVGNANVQLPPAILALRDSAQMDANAYATLTSLAELLSGSRATVKFSKWIDLGTFESAPLSKSAPAVLEASLLEALRVTARIAGQSKMIELDLGAALPGGKVSVALVIGEPMVQAPLARIGTVGSGLRTAQFRLRLNVSQALPGGQSLQVPLYLELASAGARLSDIACTGDTNESKVTVQVLPSLAEVWLGSVADMDFANLTRKVIPNSATLLRTNLLTVTGSAHAAMSNREPTAIEFSSMDISERILKSVNTKNALETLFTSLLNDLSLETKGLINIGLPSADLSLTSSSIGAVMGIAEAIINDLFNALGVKIGEADVRVDQVKCDGAQLAQ